MRWVDPFGVIHYSASENRGSRFRTSCCEITATGGLVLVYDSNALRAAADGEALVTCLPCIVRSTWPR